MKIVYTKHAEEKLKTKESRKFRISKQLIKINVKDIAFPKGVEMLKLIGKLDESHDICVILKRENANLKVITFFPAEKGRYESKIL